jgi:hypothetical protein
MIGSLGKSRRYCARETNSLASSKHNWLNLHLLLIAKGKSLNVYDYRADHFRSRMALTVSKRGYRPWLPQLTAKALM